MPPSPIGVPFRPSGHPAKSSWAHDGQPDSDIDHHSDTSQDRLALNGSGLGSCGTVCVPCDRHDIQMAQLRNFMTRKNVYPFVLAVSMFAIAIGLYSVFVIWLGFPDGFMSRLDVAEQRLAICLIWFGLAMGIGFLSLGAWSFRSDVRKPLIYTSILVLLVAAGSVALDLYFRSYMMDSRGG